MVGGKLVAVSGQDLVFGADDRLHDGSTIFRAPFVTVFKQLLARKPSAQRRCFNLDVEATPWLIVDQTPAMPCSSRVGREQDIARSQDKRLAVACRELERPRQCDDVLVAKGSMPVERRARGGFFEMRRRRGLHDTERNIISTWDRPSVPVNRWIQRITPEAISSPIREARHYLAVVPARRLSPDAIPRFPGGPKCQASRP